MKQVANTMCRQNNMKQVANTMCRQNNMKQVANTMCRQNKFLDVRGRAKLQPYSWKDYGRTTGQEIYFR